MIMMEVTLMLLWQKLEVTMTRVKRVMTKARVKQQRRKVFQGYGTSHEIWPNLQDMEGKSCCRLPLIMHTINLSKVSFLPFHSIACSCDNTKTLSQCMWSGRGGCHNFLGRQQGEGCDFLGSKFGKGQNFWAIAFVNLPALPPVINDHSLKRITNESEKSTAKSGIV